jgi:protein tyrosine/serine phosphatase
MDRLRWWHRLLIVAFIPMLAGLWIVGDTFIEDDNFRVVTAGLYRSGQLRSDEWSESLAEHPYRSVLNLRGPNPGKDWYDLERRFSAQHGLTHVDFQLSADAEPSRAQMNTLIAIMRSAPKPLLIHCKEGSDRSGLVAALYRLAIEGVPADEARRQLSLWYGHFPWLTSHTGAMDRAFDDFVSSQPGV